MDGPTATAPAFLFPIERLFSFRWAGKLSFSLGREVGYPMPVRTSKEYIVLGATSLGRATLWKPSVK